MNEDTAPVELSHDDLVESLVDMIDDNLLVSNEPVEAKQQPKAEEETDQESDDDYLADLDSDDTEEVDTPEDSDDAEESESDDGDSTEVVLKVDGEEITVTMDELKKGYSRQSDYTKKTQELSEQRKMLEEEQKTTTWVRETEERQTMIAHIAEAQEAVNRGFAYDDDGKQVPLTKQQIEKTMANIKDAQEELNTKMAPPRINEFVEKVPDFFSKDEAVRSKKLDEMSSVMQDYGFLDKEIAGMNDPRILLMINDLLGSRDLASRVEKAKARKAEKAGVVSKPTKSSKRTSTTSRKPKESSADYDKAKQRVIDGDHSNMEDFLGDFI